MPNPCPAGRQRSRLVDARGPGVSPARHDTSPFALFAVGWMFVGSFFAMELVVGVLVDEFNRLRVHESSHSKAMLTPAQHQWVETMLFAQQQQLLQQRPGERPDNALRRLM